MLVANFDAILHVSVRQMTVSGRSLPYGSDDGKANNAISHATKDSLILLMSLVEGHPTYDGMALARSVSSISMSIGARTLFATHYHELTSLEASLEHLVNVHVATPLGKIEPGYLPS